MNLRFQCILLLLILQFIVYYGNILSTNERYPYEDTLHQPCTFFIYPLLFMGIATLSEGSVRMYASLSSLVEVS